MCGRFKRGSDKQRIATAFHVNAGLDESVFDEGDDLRPQSMQPVIYTNDDGERQIELMRWAFKVSGYSILQAQEDTSKPLTVIVFGSKVIDDDYLFLWPNATAETDYYYSDMTRASGGRHDWDNNGNLFLAERVPTQSGEACLDSISTTGAVNVGRAPITNGDEARNFVNKVLAYEQVHAVDAGSIDPYSLARITLLCDNWQHPWTFSQSLQTQDNGVFLHTEEKCALF